MAAKITNNAIRAGRFLALALCLLAGLAARAANFTASLDRDTITLGESATLSLNFVGGEPQNVPTPDVPGLEFTSRGNSSSFSFDNGQMSSSVTVTFSITADKTGQFTIPGMVANISGQRFSTPPLTLTVVQPSAPSPSQINSGSQIAFMRLSLPYQKVYQGETFSAQLQIFFRDDIQNEGNFQFTGMPADGFIVGKMSQGGRQQAQINNHVFTIIPLSVALTVSKTGTVTVGPFTANVTIVTGAEQTFFGNLVGGQQQQITMATEPITVESLPLPTQNVPASFNGAVGAYNMTVTAGPTNVAVGDPITVHVTISGQGDLGSLMLPNQAGWNNFKIFTPTSKVQANDDLGDEGSKTFEEIVTPQSANVRELPPFSFSFFNPNDGNYHTLTQPAMPLAVSAVGATPLPAMASKSSSTENQTPQDIVPIRENLGTLAQAGTPFILRPAFLALQSIPVIAFVAALVWRKRTDNLANNPRLRRQRAVAQLVAGGLVDLNKFAAENKSHEFFAMLFRLLQEQLGERLDCPAISITEADVDVRLAALGAKPETLNSLRELFQACNQARYAPIQTSQELSALAGKFKKTVSELQELNA